MHVSKPITNLSISIFPLSPVMKATLPACGILIFLDNLKIDMIYGMQKRMVINTLISKGIIPRRLRQGSSFRLCILLKRLDYYREICM
jgi:hypothetical protein